MFTCLNQGVYRAYSIETQIDNGMPEPNRHFLVSGKKPLLRWATRTEKELFNLLAGNDIRNELFNLPQSQQKVEGALKRMAAIEEWLAGNDYTYVDKTGSTFVLPAQPVVVSDPVRIKESYYCYYWMFNMRVIHRDGYVGTELIPFVGKIDPNKKRDSWAASITLEVIIWIAEPSAVGIHETLETLDGLKISDYSKVITKRYSEIGLFPCLRKAHSSIEVLKDIVFVPSGERSLNDTPHWKAIVKLHTDRLISTLSDITFTIASRQNSGSFHCFVGDTRAFFRLRDFQFVPVGKLQTDKINLEVSTLNQRHVHEFKFDQINIHGHGVHFLGFKRSKLYQPATNRSDMVVISNPCVVQEFAFAVGGSLYIAENFLRLGSEQTKRVVVPYFPHNQGSIDPNATSEFPDFLRVSDVAFTPTHVVFLMAEGDTILHPSSAKIKGIADISETRKYRPHAIVKRRWCPRTASPKLSANMVPMLGEQGDIVVLQIYPTEGNVPMWVSPPSPSCVSEGLGFVKKVEEITSVINETDIHYDDFAGVTRTDHKTGLVEPPVPSRPPPPPPPERDIYEETSFILDSSRDFVVEGEDPHFPPERIDPASHVLENNLIDYNRARIYVVKRTEELKKICEENSLTCRNDGGSKDYLRILGMEFTSAEKQFVYCVRIEASEINALTSTLKPPAFQAIISTVTITNFPQRVKLKQETADEKLETYEPFPGFILVRMQHFHVTAPKSRDESENLEHANELSGSIQVEFVPELHILGTSLPSYVVNLGNVLMFSSIEGRYARPLHYFRWEVLHEAESRTSTMPPLFFNESHIMFGENQLLHDIVVTEQGMMSLLRRKSKRHLVQDDVNCLQTPDSETQRAVIGSVVTLEGLRELKPFFRNDNIFQRATPDGEIVYGVYDVKPRAAFKVCGKGTTIADTINDPESCVQQATDAKPGGHVLEVCTPNHIPIDNSCRDPAYLLYCDKTAPPDPTHSCLRCNNGCGCDEVKDRQTELGYDPPKIVNSSACDTNSDKITKCLPKHAPQEELRSANILGTSYQSYLQGSLESVRTLHPEADVNAWEREVEEEGDICPFVSFDVFYKQIDFAEVGYQIRVTAHVSYIGTDIPPEADVLVEYEEIMGVVIVISTSVEVIRQVTNVIKTVDIHFHIPDYVSSPKNYKKCIIIRRNLFDLKLVVFLQKLDQMTNPHNGTEKQHQRDMRFDFDDIRAREKFSVLGITFRPTIINMRCKSTDMFKTIQFNVGCNPSSFIRLMSEATALKKVNWTDVLEDAHGYRWYRDYSTWNMTIPKVHIYYMQTKKGSQTFNCSLNPNFCAVPYFHLFQNEIYDLSYRDYLSLKFEQFMTFSTRPVSGNVVLYDLLGSADFNWTLNKYKADCHNLA